MEEALSATWQTIENIRYALRQPYQKLPPAHGFIRKIGCGCERVGVRAFHSFKSFRQPTDLSVGGHPTAPPHEFIRGCAYEFIRLQKN